MLSCTIKTQFKKTKHKDRTVILQEEADQLDVDIILLHN